MLETYIQPSIWHSDRIDDVEKVIFLKDYTKISLEDLYFQKSQTRISKKLLMITQDVVNKIVVDDDSKTALQDVKDKILSLILIYDEVAEDANNLMHYIAKVEKKGRTKEELHQVIEWLTGYDENKLQKLIEEKVTFEQFFREATINDNAQIMEMIKYCSFIDYSIKDNVVTLSKSQ